MTLVSPLQSRRLTSALAAWMMVVSLGVTISHAHAVSGAAHVHGFGWNGPAASSTPATDDEDQPGESHCHFILLGFELPGESAPPDGAAVQSVLAHESAGVVGDEPVVAGDSLTPAPAASHSPAVIAHRSPLPTIPPFMPLSPFASRAVSGVLRS